MKTLVLPPSSALSSLAAPIPPATALAQALAENKALRHQVAKLQDRASVCMHNPNPVVRISMTGEVLFANPAAKQFAATLSSADKAWACQLLQVLAAGGNIDLNKPLNNRYFQLSSVRVSEPTESLLLYLSETTARVQAEQQLLEQQTFTQTILDTSANLVCVRDANSKHVFENRAMTEFAKQMPHFKPGVQHAPDSVEAQELAFYAESDLLALATKERIKVQTPVSLLSGEIRWFYTIKQLMHRPDGTPQVLCISTDITEQKLAAQALELSEKRYRDLMAHSQALICTHDLEGTLLSVNPAVAAMIGQPVHKLVGQNLRDVCGPRYEEQAPLYLEHIAREGNFHGLMKLHLAENNYRYLLSDNHLVDEPDHKPYVIAYGQDITDRVLAERALRLAKEKAEAAVRARENFLANISHEIRTPLNGVLGMASQLAKTPLDARQLEFVHTIRHSGQHLLHVINDVLDMAKITSGKLELESVPFNLCDSMAEAIRPLALQATEKGLIFSGVPLRATCSYPWVLGDPHRINQILINLVANAIKFTPPGGRVSVIGEQISETANSLTVCFRVQDTGIGIAIDKQSLIFEDFAQAYADTGRRFGGTGLGLSISRGLVEQLGGQLTLCSAEDEGSTFAFTLTLPKAPSSAVQVLTQDHYDTGALQGRRILVVEDNEINRTVARLLLEGWGAQVDEAEDGLAGVARVNKELPYDLILMDIQLPGLNGLDATAAIRAIPCPARAERPIVALTANAFRADSERYLAAGMDACLAKPFDEEEVYRTLVQLLSAAPTPAPAYDLSRLHALARGRDEFVWKIIHSFLRHIPESMAQVAPLVATQQWDALAKVIHHIKPSLELLLVPQVAEQLHLLSHAATADAAQLDEAVTQLDATIKHTCALLPHELPPAELAQWLAEA
ncbi:MAG: ATP-binding protein [Janthinobacterium lividum]